MKSLRAIYQSVLADFEASKERREKCEFVLKALEMGYSEPAIDVVRKTDFEDHQSRQIFAAVVKHDNLEVFKKAVFGKLMGGDPNFCVVEDDRAVTGRQCEQKFSPLLSYAITHGARKIAMEVAQNPRTDITQKGKTVRYDFAGTMFMSSAQSLMTQTAHESAVDLSRKAGMKGVTAILLERTAAMHLADAERLRTEAQKLKP